MKTRFEQILQARMIEEQRSRMTELEAQLSQGYFSKAVRHEKITEIAECKAYIQICEAANSFGQLIDILFHVYEIDDMTMILEEIDDAMDELAEEAKANPNASREELNSPK